MSEGSPTEQFGPYLVYEQLGIGGMAQVHRAVDTNSAFRRPVALKRMLRHIAGSEEMVKSFVREARLASFLRHENVAQTYDLGRVGDVYFIVMELVTGRNLREVLRHCGVTTGPMPVPIALNILNQICDALDYAHNLRDETGQPLGIIHRDVSPSNVIVSENGVVKLIDFGIAKASGGGLQTMSGTLKGKFAYMAPEYIAGRIDARADLFAVGVIAHELLTNRPLFTGRDDIDTLTRVRDMHIEPPSKKNPQVPAEIDDIVMTALSRDPERRWQHATALRTALTTLTRRLGLVASNAQVIEWLDRAFAQAPKRRRAELDTQPDIVRIAEDPSISIEPSTVEVSRMSRRITAVKDGAPATAPAAAPAPAGTPDHLPAQRPRAPLADIAGRAARHAVLAPGAGPSAAPLASSVSTAATQPVATAAPGSPGVMPAGAVPPVARPSAPRMPPASGSAPPRARPSSAPPPVQGSQALPTPVVPGLHLLLSTNKTLHAPAVPIPQAVPAPRVVQSSPAVPLPVTTARTVVSSTPPSPVAPSPAVPPLNAAPFAAPRPSVLSSRSTDPARPALAQADRPGNRLWTVVLVILAAAVAASTVYFVLPLLT